MTLQIKLASISNPELFMELIERATSNIYMYPPIKVEKTIKVKSNQSNSLIHLENTKDTTRFINNLSMKEDSITIIVHTVKDYYNFLYYSMFGY